jgi:hypothetical protein
MPYRPLVNWEVSSWLQPLDLIELVAACGEKLKGRKKKRAAAKENGEENG